MVCIEVNLIVQVIGYAGWSIGNHALEPTTRLDAAAVSAHALTYLPPFSELAKASPKRFLGTSLSLLRLSRSLFVRWNRIATSKPLLSISSSVAKRYSPLIHPQHDSKRPPTSGIGSFRHDDA